MDFTALVPRPVHSTLAWLGKLDWITITPTPEFGVRLCMDEKLLRRQVGVERHWPLLQRLFSRQETALQLLPLSKCLALGPKLFRPTKEQCEALAQTAVTIPFEDYRQPYPAVVIEFPEDYRRQVEEQFKINSSPRFVVAHHDEGRSGAVAVYAYWQPDAGRGSIGTVMCPRPEYRVIEDALTRSLIAPGDDAADFAVAELVERLALNFCLMLTHLGVKQIGHLDPAQARKHRKLARSKYTEERERGELLALGDFTLLDFKQHVRLHEVEERPGEWKGGTHRTPKPHWRRGHWKRQPFGVGRSQRRLVFVKPVFVNLRQYRGDLKDTSVVYES
jgi:hypothetical protein